MMYVSLFSALEEENKNFNKYSERVRFYVDEQISEFESMKKNLVELLNNVKTKKIMVVESGRFASIPLLLKSLDNRVDFRLFTTTPQFYGVYKNKYFTDAYDKNRLFETLVSQNDLFQFSDFKNGEFYIVETSDKEIKEKAIKELSQFYNLVSKC